MQDLNALVILFPQFVILGGDWDWGQGLACREGPCCYQCGVQEEKNRQGFRPGTPY